MSLFHFMFNSVIEELLLNQSDFDAVLGIVGHEKEEMVRAYKLHNIVRLTSSKKLILHQATNSSDILSSTIPPFVEYLKKCNKANYFELLFICTLYPLLLPRNFRNLQPNSELYDLPFLAREILQIGNGYLLYNNQLEILFSSFSDKSQSEAILFRKDWNLKKNYTRDLAKSIEITSKMSLYDLIDMSTINRDNFFYQANFHGANNLYCALNNT